MSQENDINMEEFGSEKKLYLRNEFQPEEFTNNSMVSEIWSWSVIILNIFTYYGVIFWASTNSEFNVSVLMIAILVECVLFCELIVRMILRCLLPFGWKMLNLHHTDNNDGKLIFLILFLGSLPILTGYAAIKDPTQADQHFDIVSKLLLTKFLRAFEVQRATRKIEAALFYKNYNQLVVFRILKSIVLDVLIVHISTCSWLYVTSLTNQAIIPGEGSHNPFKTNLSYFERQGKTNMTIFAKYVDASVWSMSTLTGSSFGDVTPRTFEEVTLSILILFAGLLTMAAIFSKISTLLYVLNRENTHAREQSQQALKLCKVLGIPPRIRYKIQAFYAIDNDAVSQTQNFSSLKDLPKTLYTDVTLALNEQLIDKVNLFTFGPPAFVSDIVRAFSPRICMADDYVVRVGDYADEMYFIKQGEVEVLATDNQTQIAILREGAYFGEIGLLKTEKRTVYIRTLTFCVFHILSKNDFNTIMDAYPKQKNLLMQVAEQRHCICTRDDVEITKNANVNATKTPRIIFGEHNANSDEEKDTITLLTLGNYRSRSADLFSETGTRASQLWKKIKEYFKFYACRGKELDFTSSGVILPTSRFHHIWVIILFVASFLNQFLIPYEISFRSEDAKTDFYWWLIDVVVVIVYGIDIFVHMNTSIKHKGMYTSDKFIIYKKYVNQKLAKDVIAFIPFDYLMLGIQAPHSYIAWIKLLRFAKQTRVISLVRKLHFNVEKKSRFGFLIILTIFYIVLNHFAACIMYMIASYENRFEYICMLKELEVRYKVDLTTQTTMTQYIYFIYWAFSLSSSGSYGDIRAVTSKEKIFQVVSMLFFRVYFAFCTAVVSNLVSSAYVSFTENLAKQTMYEKWMNHIKLPEDLMKRIRQFNALIWDKYKGLDENQILNSLPGPARQEMLEFLLSDMLDNLKIFPEDEVGLYSYIIKDFSFLVVTKDEYVFKAGETAEEMFFIIEGEVEILNDEDNEQVALLTQNGVFGEMAIIEGKVSARTKNAKAKTDVSLGVIHLAHIKEMWKKFPEVKKEMNKMAELRQKQNYQNFTPAKKENDWILKGVLTSEGKQQTVERQHINQVSEGELEFEKLQKEIEKILDEEDESITIPDSRKLFINVASATLPRRSGSESDGFPPPPPRYDPSRLKKTNIYGSQVTRTEVPEDFENISKVSFKGFSKLSSQQDIDGILKPLKTEPEYKSNEKMDECFVLSNVIEDSKQGYGSKRRKTNKLVIYLQKTLDWLEKSFRIIRPPLMSLITLFEWLFRPWNQALSVTDFNDHFKGVEAALILVFFMSFLIDLKAYLQQRSNRGTVIPEEVFTAVGYGKRASCGREEEKRMEKIRKIKKVHILTVILNFIFIIPFQMIFVQVDLEKRNKDVLLILFQLSRLLAVHRLLWLFQLKYFKRKYALANILISLCAFSLMNHLFACQFIVIANSREDFSNTWYVKVPAPQFDFPNNLRTSFNVDRFTKYMHALYWSYVSTSHIGIGDVTAINTLEKGYNIFVITTSMFVYAYIFGNLASLVDDLTPKFQQEFEANYKKALAYVKSSKLESFVNKVHNYYTYIWQNSKGVDENVILAELPNSIKYDIFLTRYNEIVLSSIFFQNKMGEFDQRIFYSFCKKCRYGIFMKRDYLITIGQQVNDVYLILEGSADVIELKMSRRYTSIIGPGDYFGGIFSNMTQIQNVRAKEMIKVAILPQECFLQLKEAYPDWFSYIIKYERIYKIGHKLIMKLRRRVKLRKTNPEALEPLTLEENIAPFRMDDKFDPVPKLEEVMNPDTSNISEDFRQRATPITTKVSLKDTNTSRTVASPPKSQSRKRVSFNPANIEVLSHHEFPIRSPGSTDNHPMIPKDDGFFQHNIQKSTFSPTLVRYETAGDSQFKRQARTLGVRKAGILSTLQKEEKKSWLPKLSLGRLGSMFRSSNKIFPEPVSSERVSSQSSFGSTARGFKVSFRNHKNSVDEDEPMHAAVRRKSTSNPNLLQMKSSLSRVPTFLIQEEEEEDNDLEEYGDHMQISNGAATPRSARLRNKNIRKITLRKNSLFMARNMAEKADRISDLISKLTEQTKKLKFYVNPNSKFKIFYEFIHTLIIIYSIFAVPLFVGFDIKLTKGLIAVEIIVLVEQIIYVILLSRTAQYVYGILTLERKILTQKLLDRGIIVNLLATIPFNLIFAVLGINEPLIIVSLLKSNRILLAKRLPSQLSIFSAKFPRLATYLNPLRTLFNLTFSIHLLACFFRLTIIIEPKYADKLNFEDILELDLVSTTRKYLIFLAFVMNIATTTGYPELIIYNNYERIILILCIYFGDALFASLLGWYSAHTDMLDRYNGMFDKIRKIDSIVQKETPKNIRFKVESYFKYVVDTKTNSQSCFEFLSGLLPESMLKDIAYDQAKALHNLPLLDEFKTNRALKNEIVKSLRRCIYLPQDYIITRGEIGSEIFTIEEGTVHMLSPCETKIIGILHSGEYFGELGAYTTTKRLASFVASTFCLIYILDKDVLKAILKRFPHANFEFKLFAKKRIDNNTSLLTHVNNKNRSSVNMYTSLQRLFTRKITNITERDNYLQASEIPHYMLRNSVELNKKISTDDDGLKNIQNQRMNTGQFDEKAEVVDRTDTANSTFDEYIEEQEIENRDLDTKKTTFRIAGRTKERERRFSRINPMKEQTVSKTNGIKVRWGFNMG